MKRPLLESQVTIIGTLVGPGDFQWAQELQSVSPDTRRTVEQSCSGYKPQKTVHAEQVQNFPESYLISQKAVRRSHSLQRTAM
jgi:hypothetical protein